jgi:beta-glucosidase-like glycosyl hydrolase
MTLSERVGQFFSPAAFVHDTEENIKELEKLIREHHIGGITFFHSRISAAANFEKRQEILSHEDTLQKLQYLIRRYQAASKTPLLISIDAEYGMAMRIEHTPAYPFAIALGALPESEEKLVFEVGERMGKDLKNCGIHLNLAPVADINTNPDNPVIGYRSFGPDKDKVSRWALAMYNGLVNAGIGACYKHFPGHGDTHVDSHLGLPVIHKTKAELMDEELRPFAYGIAAGVEMIMVGHLAAPALSNGKVVSASLSHEIITDLLKGEMGFDGIVISDALNMKSVSGMFMEKGQLEWEAFHAGNDILCFSEHVPEGIKWILQKATTEEIILRSEKILKLKKQLIPTKLPSEKRYFDLNSFKPFQLELAEKCLSVLKHDPLLFNRLTDFSSTNLSISVSIGIPSSREFEDGVNAFGARQCSITEACENPGAEVIVAVFVPSAKPLNRFGLDEQDIENLKIIASFGKCHLFLFGNPLALKEMPFRENFVSIICCFNGSSEAQTAALKYLQNKLTPTGKLDLSI